MVLTTYRMNLATSSKEYAKRLDKKPIAQPVIPNKDELNSREPLTLYRQITPIDPVRSSKNWATEKPERGFNMDDLNTFVIRPADRKQTELFDRYILGDSSRLFSRDVNKTTLGTLIGEKLGPNNQSRSRIAEKRIAARSALKGGTYGSVKHMKEK